MSSPRSRSVVGGVFAARQHRATLNHLRLLQAQESQARVAYVMLPNDLVFISFSPDPGTAPHLGVGRPNSSQAR